MLTSHSASLGLFFHLSWSWVSLPPGDIGAVKSLNTDCYERKMVQNTDTMLSHVGKSDTWAILGTWVWSENLVKIFIWWHPSAILLLILHENCLEAHRPAMEYVLQQQKQQERACLSKMEGKKGSLKDALWPLHVHCGMLMSAPQISKKYFQKNTRNFY